ncbi:hypothetical protein SAMN06295967_10863 [Belliella buryatensis]|uniref:Uncharacterized protein n=1 Tax=Belliella buryatensis TaxID=1500549 RepID=A0A239DXL8_9BACT|nr:hypothetical protein [Belliella buryatensis]SNS36728.1 hypothetical protein SAMN06295967_10863 [Belliella buryatensis]
MRAFLKNTFLFLIILLVVNFALFLLIRGFYIKDYEEVDLDFDEFILADSHGTPLGDFAEEFEVHNFSAQSDSYLDMGRKLRYLLRKGKIERIYISVDDHTLSPTRENQNNLDRSAYYTERDDFDSWFEFVNEKYLKYYLVFLNDRYSLVIKNFITEELFDYRRWGGSKGRIAWENLTEEERRRQAQDRFENYFEQDGASEKMRDALMNIISLSREHNVELIGVRFPLSRSYYGILGEESYHADSIFMKESLRILDFDNVFLDRDSLFRDMDHLDREGGEIFVDILLDSLESFIEYK